MQVCETEFLEGETPACLCTQRLRAHTCRDEVPVNPEAKKVA